jgi:hypothetical protein
MKTEYISVIFSEGGVGRLKVGKGGGLVVGETGQELELGKRGKD